MPRVVCVAGSAPEWTVTLEKPWTDIIDRDAACSQIPGIEKQWIKRKVLYVAGDEREAVMLSNGHQ